MKIETRENIKGNIKTIISLKNERYIRLQKDKYNGLDMQSVVEWRKQRTNHLVKADKHKLLEDIFKDTDPTFKKASIQIILSGKDSLENLNDLKEKTFVRKAINDKILEHIKSGNLLAAVKFYKEKVSGIGLKEAKDYVDAINANYIAEKKWEENIQLTRENSLRENTALASVNKIFKNNAQRKQFVAEMKTVFKNQGAIPTVKIIKDRTNCGLYESKIFFDNYVKF